MAAYVIVDTDLTDPERYEQYKLRAKPLVESFGGEYLARGGALTIVEDDLWRPKRLVLLRFADAAQAQAFYRSPEYQEVLQISKASAKRSYVIVEGI